MKPPSNGREEAREAHLSAFVVPLFCLENRTSGCFGRCAPIESRLAAAVIPITRVNPTAGSSSTAYGPAFCGCITVLVDNADIVRVAASLAVIICAAAALAGKHVDDLAEGGCGQGFTKCECLTRGRVDDADFGRRAACRGRSCA